jgi:hypothetical protein
VTKKIRDARQDPPAPDEPATNFRVDRVYAPPVRPSTRDVTQVASELLARRSQKISSSPPVGGEDLELSLRRQLSRLQRQLAEAQQELANKDEELAAETEKRMQLVEAHNAVLEEVKTHAARVEELTAYEQKTRGLEQRLAEALTTGDELGEVLDKERRNARALETQVGELTRSLEETRAAAAAERKALEERTSAEHAQLEAQRAAAVAAGEEALEQATARMTEAHEAELAQVREAHERSVSTLRGELEPKVIEARTLAEDRERLASKVTALEAEAVRVAAERDEEHAREIAQLEEKHAAEVAAQARTHASELAAETGKRDAQILELQQAVRAAEARAQTAEDEVALLREGLKKIQREAADASERASQLDADKQMVEDRLQLAVATAEKLVEDKRQLREQVEASERETRRNAMDRMRFVRYLEEGLALLGALPPALDVDDLPEIEAEPLPDPDTD